MYANPEKLTGMVNVNIDTAMALANTAFAGVERLAALNINTARSVLEESFAGAKTLLSSKNPEQLASAQAALAKPAIEKGVAYSRAVYSIVTETSEQLSKVSGSRVDALKAEINDVIETATKSAPAGSEPAMAAFKTALQAANNAYDTMSKVAKQVGEIAEANVTVATDTAVKALDAVAAVPASKKAA